MNLTNKNRCVLVGKNFNRLIIKVFTNHVPYNECVLVSRNFDRLIMKAFTNHELYKQKWMHTGKQKF